MGGHVTQERNSASDWFSYNILGNRKELQMRCVIETPLEPKDDSKFDMCHFDTP
jgi:hypothetical protein